MIKSNTDNKGRMQNNKLTVLKSLTSSMRPYQVKSLFASIPCISYFT